MVIRYEERVQPTAVLSLVAKYGAVVVGASGLICRTDQLFGRFISSASPSVNPPCLMNSEMFRVGKYNIAGDRVLTANRAMQGQGGFVEDAFAFVPAPCPISKVNWNTKNNRGTSLQSLVELVRKCRANVPETWNRTLK